MQTPEKAEPAPARKHISVGTSVTLALAAAVTVVSVFLSLLSYYSDRSDHFDALAVKADRIADQLATSLVLPVWNFDRPQIDKINESAMKDDDVYAVSVSLLDLKHTQHIHVRDGTWKRA